MQFLIFKNEQGSVLMQNHRNQRNGFHKRLRERGKYNITDSERIQIEREWSQAREIQIYIIERNVGKNVFCFLIAILRFKYELVLLTKSWSMYLAMNL